MKTFPESNYESTLFSMEQNPALYCLANIEPAIIESILLAEIRKRLKAAGKRGRRSMINSIHAFVTKSARKELENAGFHADNQRYYNPTTFEEYIHER